MADIYPPLSELIALSSVSELVDLDPDEQADLRAGAIRAIEGYCRQSFTSEGTELDPVSRTLDGSGTNRLDLPKRLASLSSTTIDGSPMADGAVILSDDHGFLEMTSPLGTSWAVRARLESPFMPEPIFERYAGNVVVAGVWGWTEADWTAGLLDGVAAAIRIDMEDRALAQSHKLANTVRAARALGLSSVDQGGLSLAMRTGEPALSSRVRRELSGLRWSLGGGVTI